LRRIPFDKIKENILLELSKKNVELTLGIDEYSKAKRHFATTITLIKPKHKLLNILQVKSNKKLEKWVNDNWTTEQRYRVTEVCIDIAKSWKYIMPSLFPHAKMVIDHFHVISYLNQLIAEEYRLSKSVMTKSEQSKKFPYKTKGLGVVMKLYEGGKYWKKRDEEKIKQVFEIFPRVAERWYWKEEVRKIYFECRSKKEAKERLQIVLAKFR
jgi:transposase